MVVFLGPDLKMLASFDIDGRRQLRLANLKACIVMRTHSKYGDRDVLLLQVLGCGTNSQLI